MRDIFDRRELIIEIESKRILVKELSLYCLFKSLNLLLSGQIYKFFQSIKAEELSKLTEDGYKKFLEEFINFQLPENEGEETTEEIKERIDFFSSWIKILVNLSMAWGPDPLTIAKKYSVRQLQQLIREFPKADNSNSSLGKKKTGYKKYVDKWGDTIEEWEE
jgi:hypothetical protein